MQYTVIVDTEIIDDIPLLATPDSTLPSGIVSEWADKVGESIQTQIDKINAEFEDSKSTADVKHLEIIAKLTDELTSKKKEIDKLKDLNTSFDLPV